MFLAKGLAWWQVYAMLYGQVSLATGVGLGLATGSLWGVRIWLRGHVAPVAARFQESLNVSDLDLLPLHLPNDPLLVGGVVLGAASVGVTILLRIMPLWRRTAPSSLLHG